MAYLVRWYGQSPSPFSTPENQPELFKALAGAFSLRPQDDGAASCWEVTNFLQFYFCLAYHSHKRSKPRKVTALLMERSFLSAASVRVDEEEDPDAPACIRHRHRALSLEDGTDAFFHLIRDGLMAGDKKVCALSVSPGNVRKSSSRVIRLCGRSLLEGEGLVMPPWGLSI